MDALQQIIEGKALAARHGDLAIDHELLRFEIGEYLNQFREVARERLLRLGPQRDLVALLRHDAPEAIPFRFILPLLTFRNRAYRPRLHRRDGKFQVQSHALKSHRSRLPVV
jgi:hypothetical protein